MILQIGLERLAGGDHRLIPRSVDTSFPRTGLQRRAAHADHRRSKHIAGIHLQTVLAGMQVCRKRDRVNVPPPIQIRAGVKNQLAVHKHLAAAQG